MAGHAGDHGRGDAGKRRLRAQGSDARDDWLRELAFRQEHLADVALVAPARFRQIKRQVEALDGRIGRQRAKAYRLTGAGGLAPGDR